ncbi:MAG: hypothetical protein H7A38_00490 [Chlamydiales bacterium]|nr:hypothetical protein [Chlamydiales bacterium]
MIDIYVGHEPLHLATSYPAIHHDYAVDEETDISVSPSLKILLDDPAFIAKRDAAFGGTIPETMDLRVTRDARVLVSAPEERVWRVVDYTAPSVRTIAERTQMAYQRTREARTPLEEDMQRQIAQLQAQQGELMRALAQLTTVVSSLAEQRIPPPPSHTCTDALYERLLQSETARAAAEAKASAAEGTCARLEGRVVALEEENSVLHETALDMTTKYTEATLHLEEKERRIEFLEKKITDLHRELEGEMRKHAQTTRERDTSRNQAQEYWETGAREIAHRDLYIQDLKRQCYQVQKQKEVLEMQLQMYQSDYQRVTDALPRGSKQTPEEYLQETRRQLEILKLKLAVARGANTELNQALMGVAG